MLTGRFSGFYSCFTEQISWPLVSTEAQDIAFDRRQVELAVCCGHAIKDRWAVQVILCQFFLVGSRDEQQQGALLALKGGGLFSEAWPAGRLSA